MSASGARSTLATAGYDPTDLEIAPPSRSAECSMHGGNRAVAMVLNEGRVFSLSTCQNPGALNKGDWVTAKEIKVP